MAEKQAETWFVYQRRPGEIHAVPANLRGWLALIACITATIAAALVTAFTLFRLSPLVAGLAVAAMITGGVLGTIRLAIAKGRRID